MAATRVQNAYAILGLPKGASPEQIKAAYIQQVKKYDPEKHTDRYMVIERAYQRLRYEEDRAREDVRTLNQVKGELLFNDDEKTKATEEQIDQALKVLRQKMESGEVTGDDARRKLLQGLMMRSWKHAQKRLWAEAIKDWKEVLETDPSHRRAKNNLLYSLATLGFTYANHDLYDEAIGVWKEALQMNPDDSDLIHNLALASEYAEAQDDARRYWEETVKRWKAKLDREPDNEYLKTCIIEVLRQFGDQPGDQKSPRAAGDSREGGPASAAAPAAPKGLDEYREIVKLNPDDFEAHFKVCSLLMKDQNWSEAVEELGSMRQKWPRNVEVLNALGWAMLNSGKVDEAFSVWRKARAIDPKNHQITESLIKAHMTMGRTMRDKGLFTPCLVHFKALMRYLPDNDEVHFEIAKTYQLKGDERSAFNEYQKVLKINPSHKNARHGLSALKLRR